jgi:hypothetical protein
VQLVDRDEHEVLPMAPIGKRFVRAKLSTRSEFGRR